MIVLDTSILSLAYRRRWPAGKEPAEVTHLRHLMSADADLLVPGIVLQELLSGIRTEAEGKRMRGYMAGFQVGLAEEVEHLRAAEVANACMRKGVAITGIDCLIAAMTLVRGATLWTLDKDFVEIARHTGLKLFTAAVHP
jgi:predicted nucleic acid-binding protein